MKTPPVPRLFVLFSFSRDGKLQASFSTSLQWLKRKEEEKKKAKEIYKAGWLILGVHTFIEHEGGSSENEQGHCLSRAVILITGSRDEEIVRHGSP